MQREEENNDVYQSKVLLYYSDNNEQCRCDSHVLHKKHPVKQQPRRAD